MAVNIDITKSYVLQSIHEKAKPETMFFSDRYFTTGKSDIHTEDKILVEYKKSGERKLAHFVPERGGAIPIERAVSANPLSQVPHLHSGLYVCLQRILRPLKRERAAVSSGCALS